jgi:hypothetical protein
MTAVAKTSVLNQADSGGQEIEPLKRCWRHLFFHWRFLISWIIFGFLAYSAAYTEIERNHPPTPSPSIATEGPPRTAATGRTATKSRGRSGRRHSTAIRKSRASTPRPIPVPEWTPRNTWEISKIALLWGYVGWSFWWAMPATFGIIASGLKRAMNSWLFFTVGMPIIAAALLLSFVIGVFYSLLGGGIFHAGRCWWRLCHAGNGNQAAPIPQPAVATSATASRANDVRGQMERLDALLRQALISREEYAQRRKEIIDNATRE